MRFIRQQQTITTVCNEEVIEQESIVELLNNLLKSQLEFSLILRKEFKSDYVYRNITYDKARVKKVNEDTVDFLILSKNAISNIKSIGFNEIVEIFALTKKSDIFKSSSKVSRFDLMDIDIDQDQE